MMPSRREFLQAGLAASVLSRPALEPVEGTPAPLQIPPAHRAAPEFALYRVVSDDRFSSSRVFADEAERLGVERVHTAGDITDFWYGDLSSRWKTGPVAIAGLTAHGPLFCLERLAWDHGLRVMFRGTHQRLANGQVQHTLAGPAAALALVEQLDLGTSWAARIAPVVLGCRGDSDPASAVVCSASPRVEDAALVGDIEPSGPLYSWIIAPRCGA